MTNLSILPTLQVVCILAAIANRGSGVGAFSFQTPTRAMRHSSCLSSSIPAHNIGSTGIDASPSTSVKVVNYNGNANAAALSHGPAHTAALEQARMEQTPTPSASTTEPHHNPSSTTAPSTAKTNSLKNSILKYSTQAETQERSQTVSIPPQQQQQQEQVSNAAPVPPMTPPKAARSKSPVVTAESVDDILDIMDGTIFPETPPASGLTLVLFHAHYCKICQRATMQLVKAAKEYPTVRFAKIEAKTIPEPSADNLRHLGVSKFPFLQIYRHGDCVASFSTGPSHMFLRKVRGTLDLCLERDDDCWTEFCDEFATEIRVNRDARQQLRPELLP